MNEAIKEILIKLLNNEEVRTLIKGILIESVLEGITISANKEKEKKLLLT